MFRNCFESLEDMLIDIRSLLRDYKNLAITFETSINVEKKMYILPNMKLIPSYFEAENIFNIHKGKLLLFSLFFVYNSDI